VLDPHEGPWERIVENAAVSPKGRDEKIIQNRSDLESLKVFRPSD